MANETLTTQTKIKGMKKQLLAEYYVIEMTNDLFIRRVKPYIQEFKTFAKGRWIGRELSEVLLREFGGHPEIYWLNAIKNGHVRINNQIVSESYKFRNGDAFQHKTHRHEPPVFGRIELVGETEQYMAICKPASLPMHPCGAYRFNSLQNILCHEPFKPEQPQLHLVHRLDRVTSGLVVLAKSKLAAAEISTEIRDKRTKKVYLARVRGRFPRDLSHIKQLSSIDFTSLGGEGDDDANNNEELTGSVGTKRDSCTNDEQPAGVQQTNKQSYESRKAHRIFTASGNNSFGKGRDISVAEIPERCKPALSREVVGQSSGVGYMYARDDDGVSSGSGESQQVLWLQCPIGVVSHRDGIHCCDPEGKPSISGFRMLGYCEESDTSLVECRPYSGRTHQLRLHLQFLDNPIANDPCYGGQLFYGDDSRRELALNALRDIRRSGAYPLSRVPHFSDPELDSYMLLVEQNKADAAASVAASVAPGSESVGVAIQSVSHSSADEEVASEGLLVSGGETISPQQQQQQQQLDESEDDYIVRTCRYCRDTNSSANLECFLHCDGIWLHALRYTGREWSFETAFPEWARKFVK